MCAGTLSNINTAEAAILLHVTCYIKFPQRTGGSTIFLPLDTNHFLDASVHEVSMTLIEAIILVVLIVLLFIQSAGAAMCVVRLSVQRDCWFTVKRLFLWWRLRGGCDKHLMPHLSLHPTLSTCSSDTILRGVLQEFVWGVINSPPLSGVHGNLLPSSWEEGSKGIGRITRGQF